MVGVCMFIKVVNDGLSNTNWDDRGHWEHRSGIWPGASEYQQSVENVDSHFCLIFS